MNNSRNHLKSFSVHDEMLLATMTHMVNTHPNARVLMASCNVINVEGDDLDDFLNELVKQVPVFGMKVFKVKKCVNPKQIKHDVINNGLDIHSIHFTFHELDHRRRMNIPQNQAV